MASVAHCTATFMSWPVDSARNAPWAAAWHALAGAPDRFAHANHSAYDLSSGVGPVNAGSCATSCWTISHAGFVLGSAAGAGAAGAAAAGAAGPAAGAAGGVGAGAGGAAGCGAGGAVCKLPVTWGAHVGVLVVPGRVEAAPWCWSLGAQLGIGGFAGLGAAGQGSDSGAPGAAAAAAAGSAGAAGSGTAGMSASGPAAGGAG